MLEKNVNRFIFSVLVLGLLSGCSDRSADTAVVERQVTTSAKQGGGAAIAVKSEILTDVALNEKVIVELTMGVRPYQELLLDITPSEEHQLVGNYQQIAKADKQGVAIKQIMLVPVVAGKQYLKVMIFSLNGQPLRAVSIALSVADDSGEVPQPERELKQRIELESLPVE